MANIEKISLLTLTHYWNPFRSDMSMIWPTVRRAITRSEIAKAINKDKLIPPWFPAINVVIAGIDNCTRSMHIQRIAWLAINFSNEHPVELEFEADKIIIVDGNHRIFAAAYLNLPYINCHVSGNEPMLNYFKFRN